MLVCMLLASAYSDRYSNMLQNDSWERFDLWKSAVQANSNVVFGVGTGDYKTELNDYYHEHGMTEFEEGNFNAHNQFVQIYFSNGLLGLLAVIILFGRPLYKSVKRHNAMGVLVFFSFIIYGMTEVFLGRFQGVVFYALMHQLFMSYYDATERTVVLKA
jgi:O-antigen ligase